MAKKLKVKTPKDVLRELPDLEMKVEKIDHLPPKPPFNVSVSLVESFFLWLKSWIRNEAIGEYEGTHTDLEDALGLRPLLWVIGVLTLVLGSIGLFNHFFG